MGHLPIVGTGCSGDVRLLNGDACCAVVKSSSLESHEAEVRAYERLQQHGLTGTHVPQLFAASTALYACYSVPVLVLEFIGFKSATRLTDEEKLLRATRNRVIALFDAVHKAGVLHGDVAWRNLVVQEGTDALFLIDFGHASLSPTAAEVAAEDVEVRKMLPRGSGDSEHTTGHAVAADLDA